MKRILYVDDEETNVKLFKLVFSKKYEVLTGLDGEEGLEVLRNNPDINIVISDMRMPGMNGLEFVKKAQEESKQAKFFLLTGFGITSEIQEAINKGLIIQCFCKPINKVEIEDTINAT